MPKHVVNELGQKVLEYTWEEYQTRLINRRPLKPSDDLNNQLLVVKHTWGIGDLLYLSPALRGLKQKFPKMQLHVICTNPDVYENNPDIDKVYHYMEFDDLTALGDKLNSAGPWYWLDFDVPLKGGYDYKVNLRTKPQLNEFMTSLLLKDPKTLTGDERAFVDQASTAVITRYKMVALDMYCNHAFVPEAEKSVFYYPYDHELDVATRFLQPIRDKGYKAVVLMPYSSTNFKDYPHWKEVLRLCPANYYWVIMDAFARGRSWVGPNIQDCSGLFRTRMAMAITIQADMCCSSDTGFLYPRAARGKPCVVTYGPHEPEPFLHYFPAAHGLRVPHIRYTAGMEGMCSTGCFIDTTSCHQGSRISPCLNELEPKVVAEKIQAVME